MGKGKNKIITRSNFTDSYAGISVLWSFYNDALHHKTTRDRKQHNIEYKKNGIENTKIVHHKGSMGIFLPIKEF